MEIHKALIKDSKWYDYPEVYSIFSNAEDKNQICIKIIKEYIKDNKLEITNPTDLGTGTAKLYEQLLKDTNYNGNIYLIESNCFMNDYLKTKYKNEINIVQTSIEDFDLKNNKSNFIISSFGFPSTLFNKDKCLKELKNVYKNLLEDGIFITIGWNEKWNDELNNLWKKYICDNSKKEITTPRNCNLSWYKNDIKTTLEFNNIDERDYVLYSLFGEDAENDYKDSNKLKWDMLMGITINTKKELNKIIRELELTNERN